MGAAFDTAASRLANLFVGHPVISAFLILAVLGVGFVVLFLLTPLVRSSIRKAAFLLRNAVTADRGWRDVLYWVIVTLLVAVPLAAAAGARASSTFDWHTFFFVLMVVMGGNALRVMFEALSASKVVLRPVHGARWRAERKIGTAGVLMKINRSLDQKVSISPAEIRDLLTDLLSLIVSHVRDHRGNHRRVAVFANLVLPDGENLVVVARDTNLHSRDQKRETPKRYPRGALAVARALESGQVVSVGDYRLEYPESPKNKPYSSILAIPLVACDSRVVGVLSIDSTRPYFFESFTPSAVENDMENSLAPYATTIVLVLERLLPDEANRVRLLEGAYAA